MKLDIFDFIFVIAIAILALSLFNFTLLMSDLPHFNYYGELYP